MPYDLKDPAYFDPAAVEKELARVTELCDGCRRCYRLCPSFDYMLDDAVDEQRRRPLEDHERRLPQDRRPLLAVQALLQPLPVHAAAPLGHRLPAAHAAGQGGAGEGGGRDPPGRLARATWTRVGCSGLAPPRRSRTGPTASAPARAAAGGGGGHRPDPQRCRRSTTRPSPAGSASGAEAGVAPGTPVALLLLLLGQLQRAAGGARRGVRAREERLRGLLPGAGLLRHAVPRRRRRRGAPRATRSATCARSLPARGGRGATVVVPQPTCSYVLKKEYPLLVPGAAAEKVAAATRDLFEYLAGRHKEGTLATDFPGPTPGQGRLPDALPPARPEHGLQDPRRAAAHPRRRGARGRVAARPWTAPGA